MISEEYLQYGSNRSVIRDQFDWAQKKMKEIGAESVHNFCIGNPNVPTPDSVNETLIQLIRNENSQRLHGYTSSSGDEEARRAIANGLNERYGMNYDESGIYFTVGAACALNMCFRALCNPGDEFIGIAPYFPEYKFYLEVIGVKFVPVLANPSDFQIDIDKLEKAITCKTKGIILNSPNNPSGAIYSEDTIKGVARILWEKEKEYGHPIYIVADEPYKEIIYDSAKVPYVPKYYKNTLVCNSYSKCLSLPGERIGYVAISDDVTDYSQLLVAIGCAARVLSYVNAPTIFQLLIAKCYDQVADLSVYEKNREILYNALVNMGFECVKPEGAFYLFPKALEEDDYKFCDKGKEYNIAMVPGSEFGYKGYARISYCVSTEQIKRAIPAFEKLAMAYKK